jgi:hypothetical protein
MLGRSAILPGLEFSSPFSGQRGCVKPLLLAAASLGFAGGEGAISSSERRRRAETVMRGRHGAHETRMGSMIGDAPLTTEQERGLKPGVRVTEMLR